MAIAIHPYGTLRGVIYLNMHNDTLHDHAYFNSILVVSACACMHAYVPDVCVGACMLDTQLYEHAHARAYT